MPSYMQHSEAVQFNQRKHLSVPSRCRQPAAAAAADLSCSQPQSCYSVTSTPLCQCPPGPDVASSDRDSPPTGRPCRAPSRLGESPGPGSCASGLA